MAPNHINPIETSPFIRCCRASSRETSPSEIYSARRAGIVWARMPTTLRLPAEATAKLLPSTQQNLARVYADPAATEIDHASIDELLAAQAWTELDDRFYRDIAFGTGGMRGRTIGKVVTQGEKGAPQPLDRPEFPGTGTNMLNYGNVNRAVSALGAYLLESYPGEKCSVVIAHDTRYFSPEFAQAAAKSLNALGIDALLFPEDRSTPQLSFTTRATARRPAS